MHKILTLFWFLCVAAPLWAQSYEWAQGIGSNAAGAEDGNTIAVDAAGNVLIGGEFRAAADFDPSANTATLTPLGGSAGFIAKYNGAGVYQWAFDLSAGSAARVISLSTDANDNVYALGIFRDSLDFDPSASTAKLFSASNATYDIFVAKYNSAGAYQWAFRTGASADDTGGDMFINAAGELVVTGFFQNTIDVDPTAATLNLVSAGSYDCYVARYDINTMACLGAWRWGGTGSDRAFVAREDAGGNIVVAGRFTGTTNFNSAGTPSIPATTAGTEDGFVVKFNGSGIHQWNAPLGSALGTEEAFALTIDNADNVYVGGTFGNTVDFDPSAGTANLTSAGGLDGYIAKYNSAGAYQWAISYGSTGADNVRSLYWQANQIYATGSFAGTVDFDPTAGTSTLPNSGSSDIYLARYGDASGNFIGAISVGGSGADIARAMQVRAGVSYLAGSFSTTVDFDPSPANTANVASLGATDIFVAKYAACAPADMPTITATAGSVCAGRATTLGVGAAALGGATDWHWYSSACGVDAVGTGNSITVTPSAATTYYVRAEGGCVLPASCVSFTVSINANPSLSLSPTAAACFGGATGSINSSPSAGATPYHYAWSTGSSSANLNNVGAGNYSLLLTDANGCTISQSATVTEPTALNISASSLPTACGASTGSASAIASGGTGAFSFLWSNNATGASATGLAAGNYSVTATDANGCQNSAATSVAQLGGVTASIASTSAANCAGAATGSATAAAAGGQSPYTYAWTSGSSSISATGLIAGAYVLSITDANGCLSTATTTISQPTAISASGTVTDATTGNANGSIMLQASGGTGAFSFLWSNGSSSQNLSNIGAGAYSVTISDANGCTRTESFTVSEVVSVRTLEADNFALHIFPNPAKEAIQLQFSAEETQYQIELFNALGQRLHSEQIQATSGTHTHMLPLHALPTGSYILRLSSTKGSISRPFVRQ